MLRKFSSLHLLSFLFVLMIKSYSVAQTKEQIYYRNCIEKSVKDKSVAKEMLNSLEKTNQRTFLQKGYLGIACMFKSRHSWNPISKLSYFKKGKDIFEETIFKNPKNVELRFYRATIQKNIPAFLNYRDDLKRDQDFIFKALDTLTDEDLKNRILKYKRLVETEEN